MSVKTYNLDMKGKFITYDDNDKIQGIQASIIGDHVKNNSIHVTPKTKQWLEHATDHGISDTVDINVVPGLIEKFNNYVSLSVLQDNYLTIDQTKELVNGAFKFQGTCTLEELDTKPKVQGHIWQVVSIVDGVKEVANYACNGSEWSKLGSSNGVDLSEYAKKQDVTNLINSTSADLNTTINTLIGTNLDDASTLTVYGAIAKEASLRESSNTELMTRVSTVENSFTNLELEMNNFSMAVNNTMLKYSELFAYEFVNTDKQINLQHKIYIVRNAKLEGVLPHDTAITPTTCIKLVVNELASTMNGYIKVADGSGDTINGSDKPFLLDTVMTATFVYDREHHDWVVLTVTN